MIPELVIDPPPTLGRFITRKTRSDHDAWWKGAERCVREVVDHIPSIRVDGDLEAGLNGIQEWLGHGLINPVDFELRFLVAESGLPGDLDRVAMTRILVSGVAWFDWLATLRSVSWEFEWARWCFDFRVPCAVGLCEVPTNLFRVLANVLRAPDRLGVASLTKRWTS